MKYETKSHGRHGRYGVSHIRKAVGSFAAHAGRHAARAGMSHLKRRLFGESNKEEKPAQGLETGTAPGHSTTDHVKRITKSSRRKFHRDEKNRKRIVKLLNKSSKFQQLVANNAFMPALANDNQGWVEIPIMCGNGYVSPITTHTDAAGATYSRQTETGDGLAVANVNANALTGPIKQVNTGSAINPTTASVASLAQGYVHGYMLEYEILNIQTFPIRVDVFECTVIRDMDVPSAGPLANCANFGVGNTGLLHLASNYEGTVEGQAQLSSVSTVSAVTEVSPGATPFMFPWFGKYVRVDKHHTHVLDATQQLKLEKRYKFPRAIKNSEMLQGLVAKAFISKVILISYRGAAPAIAQSTGNICAAMPAVNFGATAAATHSFAVTYIKKWVTVPDVTAMEHFGTAQAA